MRLWAQNPFSRGSSKRRSAVEPLLAALGIAALLLGSAPGQERPHEKLAGIYYQPLEGREIERMVQGNPGGRQGFNRTLTPVVRQTGGGTKMVWAKNLKLLKKHGRGQIQALMDVHVLLQDAWLAEHHLRDLIVRIKRSPYGSLVCGWYICDEPFAKSRQDKQQPLDIKRIWDLVLEIKAAGKLLKEHQPTFADFGDVQPLLRKGGDPIHGGWYDYTEKQTERAPFLWGGRWVHAVHKRKYRRGRAIVRSYAAFGADWVMINWYNDARQLKRWMKRITKEVPGRRIQIVTGYDVSSTNDAEREAWLERIRNIFQEGQRLGLAGYWLWPWKQITTGSRTYRGIGDWWENAPEKRHGHKRYAALIEGIP